MHVIIGGQRSSGELRLRALDAGDPFSHDLIIKWDANFLA